MRWHRVRTGTVVAPWAEPASALRVLGRPIAERQERAARACGLTFAGDVDEPWTDDALYWDDDVDLTTPALAAWLKAARSGARLATVERPVRVGELEVEERVELEGEGARVVGVRWGSGPDVVRVPPRGLAGKASLPGPFDATLDWWLTHRSATTVRHWVHLLRANLAAISAEVFAEVWARPWRPLWTMLRSPLRPRWIAMGRGCEIHPSAVLESCVLGDGVKVGAHSVLRGCVLGDGAVVEDHVTARGSVVEAKGHLANYCMFNLSVLGERSSVGHIGAQASVIGRGSFVSTFATLRDLQLTGTVRVKWGERLLDSGVPFLGCAVGHEVRLGAQVVVAPGREVPNGVRVVAEDAVLTRVRGDEAPGDYVVRGGRLTAAGT
jgi:acetyltransferase-like isoleucine patch superfamily enzyme